MRASVYAALGERRIGSRDRARRADPVACWQLHFETTSIVEVDVGGNRQRLAKQRTRLEYFLDQRAGRAWQCRDGSRAGQRLDLRESRVRDFCGQSDVKLESERLSDFLAEKPSERSMRWVDVANQLLHV